ncbi:MAG: FtsQ-type POTRA domain-containing protein [Proteobacteria bacterium]|nr:FtsQ-type POTRA domain-containing protein [Pseudomonadota bacterium]
MTSTRWTRSKARITRFERNARERRSRARAHLERRQKTNRPAPGLWRQRLHAAGLFAGSLALGMLLAPILFRWATTGTGMGAGGAPTRVTSIAVQGHERLRADQVALATGLEPGAPLGELEPGEMEARLAEHDWIESAAVMAAPSGRLWVRVTERKPRAVLVQSGSAERRFVDGSGTPFAPLAEDETSELPVLRSSESLPTGEPDPVLAEAVALAEELRRRGIGELEALQLPQSENPAEGWVLQRRTPPRIAVLGAGDGQLGARLDRLSALLRTDLDAVRRSARVDLRFRDRAVLRPAGNGGKSGSR